MESCCHTCAIPLYQEVSSTRCKDWKNHRLPLAVAERQLTESIEPTLNHHANGTLFSTIVGIANAHIGKTDLYSVAKIDMCRTLVQQMYGKMWTLEELIQWFDETHPNSVPRKDS